MCFGERSDKEQENTWGGLDSPVVRVVGSPVGSCVAMCQADGCLQCTNSNKTQGNFLVGCFFSPFSFFKGSTVGFNILDFCGEIFMVFTSGLEIGEIVHVVSDTLLVLHPRQLLLRWLLVWLVQLGLAY